MITMRALLLTSIPLIALSSVPAVAQTPQTTGPEADEDLAQYHLHPESKFLNGDYFDRGTTLRRHVRMIATRHIGKESNDWERQAILGLDPDAAIDYSLGREDSAKFQVLLQAHIDAVGVGPAAKALGMTRQKAEKLARGNGDKSADAEFSRFAARLQAAMVKQVEQETLKGAELQALRDRVERGSLRETARQLGVDTSNLRRRLNPSGASR